MIRLRIRPLYSDEWTEIFLDGEQEDSIANNIVSGILSREGDAEIFTEGEWIEYQEWEGDSGEDS